MKDGEFCKIAIWAHYSRFSKSKMLMDNPCPIRRWISITSFLSLKMWRSNAYYLFYIEWSLLLSPASQPLFHLDITLLFFNFLYHRTESYRFKNKKSLLSAMSPFSLPAMPIRPGFLENIIQRRKLFYLKFARQIKCMIYWKSRISEHQGHFWSMCR